MENELFSQQRWFMSVVMNRRNVYVFVFTLGRFNRNNNGWPEMWNELFSQLRWVMSVVVNRRTVYAFVFTCGQWNICSKIVQLNVTGLVNSCIGFQDLYETMGHQPLKCSTEYLRKKDWKCTQTLEGKLMIWHSYCINSNTKTVHDIPQRNDPSCFLQLKKL